MDVDIANQRDVWLVKVPKYVAESLNKAPRSAELGKLFVPKDSKNESVKFVLDTRLREQAGHEARLPSEYHLALNPLDSQHMVILAQDKPSTTSTSTSTKPTASSASNSASLSSVSSANTNSIGSDKISFEGNVKFRGELKASSSSSYMTLKATSIKQAAKPTRTTIILDKAVTSYKPGGATQRAYEAEMRKKKEEAKKTIREEKETVQGRLFSAFEKQQFYNIKDLVRLTNQPAPYLKEILKEICNYCSKSTHKNMWELKPEYRHYKSTTGSQDK